MVAQTLGDFKPTDLGDGVDGPNKKKKKFFNISETFVSFLRLYSQRRK